MLQAILLAIPGSASWIVVMGCFSALVSTQVIRPEELVFHALEPVFTQLAVHQVEGYTFIGVFQLDWE